MNYPLEIATGLYNSPLHEYYRNVIPAEAFNKYNDTVRNVCKLHCNVIIIDLSRDLSDESDFHDVDHVSKRGSMLVGCRLKKILNH